jgi:hypothetical protein
MSAQYTYGLLALCMAEGGLPFKAVLRGVAQLIYGS